MYGDPIILQTHGGVRYFLNVVNEFSGGTWIFLIQFKNESFPIIKNLLTMIKT